MRRTLGLEQSRLTSPRITLDRATHTPATHERNGILSWERTQFRLQGKLQALDLDLWGRYEGVTIFLE